MSYLKFMGYFFYNYEIIYYVNVVNVILKYENKINKAVLFNN